MHHENDTTSDGEFTLGTVTIEHIAPQNWQRHWKEDLDFGGSDEEKRHLDQLVHLIGNLTLVAYNPKLSDHPWTKKRELLGRDRLEMNRRLLLDMEGTTWNEAEIRRRSRQLAGYVNRIWPYADVLRHDLGIAQPEGEPTPENLLRISIAAPASFG